MGFNYNQVTLVGRLTKAPEFKQVSDSFSKLSFSLAVNRPHRKGEEIPEADFIPVTLFGYAATLGHGLLKKGMPVLVWGRMSVRSYEKNNEKRWMTEVLAENFQILERLLGREEDVTEQKEDQKEPVEV